MPCIAKAVFILHKGDALLMVKIILFPLASLPGPWKRRAATSLYDPAFSFLLFRNPCNQPRIKATPVVKFPTSVAGFITVNRLFGLCSLYAWKWHSQKRLYGVECMCTCFDSPMKGICWLRQYIEHPHHWLISSSDNLHPNKAEHPWNLLTPSCGI